MTDERWQEINEFVEAGDPLKDIGCNDEELIEYIMELRKQLKKKKKQA